MGRRNNALKSFHQLIRSDSSNQIFQYQIIDDQRCSKGTRRINTCFSGLSKAQQHNRQQYPENPRITQMGNSFEKYITRRVSHMFLNKKQNLSIYIKHDKIPPFQSFKKISRKTQETFDMVLIRCPASRPVQLLPSSSGYGSFCYCQTRQ